MIALSYRITLLEPTLVAGLDGDPNSATSLDYLPGSVLRGAVIAKYLTEGRPALDITDPVVRRLFFDGSTRFLNGYPRDEHGRRFLPTPLSLHRNKEVKHEVHDFASSFPDPEDPRQWQVVPQPFCHWRDDSVLLLKAKESISIHIAREVRRAGRPIEGEGQVFRYDALAADQAFGAVVLCEQAADLALLRGLLKGPLKLGGARTGGYGRAEFAVDFTSEDWHEVPVEEKAECGDRLVITLLSDALVRDEYGQFTTDPKAVIGAMAKHLPALGTPTAFFRGQLVGGFNRKWGLPTPQALGVHRGSVYVFAGTAAGEEGVRILEAQGIGERRAEGFGRVAVNWHGGRADWTGRPIAAASRAPAISLADNHSRAQAERMVGRIFRDRLDAALAERISRLAREVKQPSKSQLSRLRSVVESAMRQSPTGGRTRLRHYLENLASRPTAARQFSRDRVAGLGLLEWLLKRVTDESTIWTELGVQHTPLPTIGGVSATQTPDRAYEYNLRLIHGVLAQAAKRKRKENA